MALKKSTTLPSGAVAEYYRISELFVSKLSVRLKISLYLSKDARDSGCSPVIANIFQSKINQAQAGFSFSASGYDANLYEEAYTFLKTLDMFEGAIDV